jgi:hypothetical protein
VQAGVDPETAFKALLAGSKSQPLPATLNVTLGLPLPEPVLGYVGMLK